jgi:hypothetical protein
MTLDMVNPVTGATSETGISIPISNFLENNDGGTSPTSPTALSQYYNIPSGTELQPEIDLSQQSTNPEVLASADATTPNDLLAFLIPDANEANSAISPAVDIPVSPPVITNPNNAPQEGTTTTIADGPAGFSGNIVQVGNDLWGVETVADPTTGNSDLRWYEINATTDAIEQTGLISGGAVSYYNASISVESANGQDMVAIGFTGSSKNEYASAYAVTGETVVTGGNQLTTFSTPILLAAGAGSYNVPVNGSNAWGAYSATMIDPNVEPSSGFITGATNASPIVITTFSTFGLTTGDTVIITGVGGNTAANGTFTITVLSATQFELNGTTGTGTYTSGGRWVQLRPAVFWTFQEYASGPNTWSVEMAEITVALPQPAPTLQSITASSLQLNEDNGTVTIEALLTAPSSDDVEVNLLLSGTATLNDQYSLSNLTIFIPAGSLTGTVTLTGLQVDTSGTPSVTISVDQASLYNATFDPSNHNTVTVTVEDTDTVAAGNLSGEVYNDLNFSGSYVSSDPGIANVLVFLDTNGSDTFNVATDPYIFTSAAAASAGDYTFYGLASGSYDVFQVVPTGYDQTQPSPAGTGYSGKSPTTSGLNFGDAQFTNPNASLKVNIPQITDDKSSGTLTITLAQKTAAAVSVVIEVGGMAPFGDYTLTGPSGTVTLSAASPTFTATIPTGQTSVAYTITANADTTGTDETITFRAVSISNAVLTGSSQVETSIVTASGSSQLVVDSPTQNSTTGTAGYSFGSPTLTFQAGDQPDYMIEADLDGNGIPDLVVCNSQASSITVILNPTSASPSIKTYSVGVDPTGVVAADFNNDGALDLAVSTSTGVTILKNSGYGTFTVSGSYAAGSAPSAITAGDFNGNGYMDIAVANANSNTVSILYGNGNMTFKTAVNVAVGSDPTDIKAANLANNGITDLVVANNGSSSNSVTVLLNNGSGTFTATSYTAGVQPHSIAIADFTGDGDLDIAVTNVGAAPDESGNINTVTVLMGNGKGQFTSVGLPVAGQALPSGTYYAGPSVYSIAVGTVAGSGLPDLIVGNNGIGNDSISILANNGNGTFSTPTLVATGTGNVVESVVAADFYGNGAIDIASANSYGTAGVNGVTIFQNADVPSALIYHVYLSHAATTTVTVNYATQNGTATAHSGYTPESGTLRFSPGTTVETIAVPVLAGAGNDQTVILQLSGATSNAPIQVGTGVGTINPPAPATSTAAASVSSGNLVVNDSTQGDSLQFLQLGSGKVEVLVNGEELAIETAITGQVQVTTPQGLDNLYVDEEVTEAGTVTNSGVNVNKNYGDYVFAELVNGANWLLQA